MKVSGTAILTRKAIITKRFGAEAWMLFFGDIVRGLPYFRAPLVTQSRVPVNDFLAFHDALLRRFYRGNEKLYFELGEESAQWALTEGPYARFVAHKDIARFVGSFPRLWTIYFSETTSSCRAEIQGDDVDLKAIGLPAWHPYFEYLVVGYMKGALDLLCANPISVCRVFGGSSNAYHYRFRVGGICPGPEADGSDPASTGFHSAAPFGQDGQALAAKQHALSDRELEVLRLVGQGKTNKEIAFLLSISSRTVQHHIARIYDKLGLYSRAGATHWLIENGLVEESP